MKRRISGFVRGGFRSVLYRYFFLFLSLALMIQLVNLVTYRMNLWYFEKELKSNYGKSLSTIAMNLDNVFTGIYNSNYLLSLDQEAMQVFSSNFAVDRPEKYAYVSQTVRSLARIRLMSDYLGSVYIYKKNDGLVVSDQGTHPASDFFGRSHSLERYPEAFWREFGSQSRPFLILPPSKSTSLNGAYVLPIVQTNIAEYKSNDLYVIDLKVDPIIELLNRSKLTPNSKIYILDDEQEVIASTEMNDPDENLDRFARDVLASNGSTLRATVDRTDVMAIQSNERFIFKNLNMIAIVPMSDIHASMRGIKYWGTVLTLSALLLAVLVSFLLSCWLYAPIQSLIGKLPAPDSRSGANEYKLLDRGIHRMLDDVNRLNDKLTSISPLAVEQWLGNLLRFKRVPDEREAREFLDRCRFEFRHGRFVAALIRVKYSKSFYMDNTPAEQHALRGQIANLIRDGSPSSFQSFVVEIEANAFGLLINVPADSDRVLLLTELFGTLAGLPRHNDHLADISAGVGGVHNGLEGLQESYVEAMKALWRLSPYENERFRYYEPRDTESVAMLLDAGDDRKIFNLLAAAKRTELFELLGSVIRNHALVGLNELATKELCMHLFVIGSQVLKHKEKTLPEAVYREYFRMILTDHSLTIEEMTEFILGYFAKIMDALQPPADESLESLAFKAYIDANFHEDLHLESLASKFRTTPSYMSRLLKKELGKPFHQYLQEKRIERAKELLAGSSIPIQDIWASVGFNNRNSFIRSFRKLEGIAPSDYRNQYSGY